MYSTFGANGNGTVLAELTGELGMLEMEADTPMNLGLLAKAVEAGSRPRAFLLDDPSSTAGPTARLAPQQDRVAELAHSLAQAISQSVGKQQERLDAAIRGLGVMRGTNEQLTETVASLRIADSSHESGVAAVSQEMRELSGSMAEGLDALFGRLNDQQQELSAVKSALSEVSQSVASLSERLGRQDEVIRSICDSPTMAEVALDQFVEIWTRWKAPSAPANAVAKIPLSSRLEKAANGHEAAPDFLTRPGFGVRLAAEPIKCEDSGEGCNNAELPAGEVPFVPGRTSLQQRAEYNFRSGQHELLLCLRRLREEEVHAVRVGQAEFGLMLYDDLIFLLYRFGDGIIVWNYAPYSWHLLPADQQQLPEAPATAERQAVLQVILVDADRNVVRALRAVTLSLDFTHTLHEAIRRQAGQPWDPAAYDKQLERAYQKHPTTEDMLAACAVGCRGGD